MFHWLEKNPYFIKRGMMDNRKGQRYGFDWVEYHEFRFKHREKIGELYIYISEMPVHVQWLFVNKEMYIQSVTCHYRNGPEWIGGIIEEVYRKYDEYAKEQGYEILTVMPTSNIVLRNSIFNPNDENEYLNEIIGGEYLSKTERILELEQTPIEYLCLTRRAFIALKKESIYTIGQLLSYPIENIPNIKCFGKRTTNEVLNRIHTLKEAYYM